MPIDIAELEPGAEEGSIVDQGILGICLLYGYGTQVSYERAFHWLSSASRQGASRPTLHLGLMFAQGLATKKDVAKAIELISGVARPSDSSDAYAARIELGRIYARELNDTATAMRWYSAALELINPGDEPSDDTKEAQDFVTRYSK